MQKAILLAVVFVQVHAALSARDVLGELASLPVHPATERTTRSVSPRQLEEVCSDQELFNQLYSVFCDPTHGQAFISALTQCEDTQRVQQLVNWCSKNEDGTFCYEMLEAIDYAIEDVSRDGIKALCINTGTTVCTPECRTALSNFRQNFGCCANAVNVSGTDYYSRFYDYSLWSSCGVETPGFCGDSTLSFIPTPGGQECSFEMEQRNLFNMFYCDPSHGNVIVNAYTACGHFETADYLVSLCGRNEDGKHCYEFTYPENEDEHAYEVQNACRLDSGLPSDSCSSTCRNTLEDYKNNLGCCVNAYNNTISDFDTTTSYKLWQACGVETPGFCPSTLGGAPSTHTRGLTIATALALAYVFVF